VRCLSFIGSPLYFSKFMPAAAPEIHDQPVPENVLAMARQAVEDFHECFWWWNQDFLPASREDVR
jgi:hypothetical protein